MDSANTNKTVSTTKAPGYTETVIGKDMSTTKVVSSSSSSGGASSPQDPNPMSSSGFAKEAKAQGLPYTAPVRPTF